MLAAVTVIVFTLGCVTSQEQPAYIIRQPPVPPGPPPQLAPIDISDDIFRPDFLNNPNSHFVFASRTNRLDVKPLVMQVDGNIQNYISRRTRQFANRLEKEDRVHAEPTISPPRTRGTPPPPPPPPPSPSLPPADAFETTHEIKSEETHQKPIPQELAHKFEKHRLLAIKAMAEEIDRIRGRSNQAFAHKAVEEIDRGRIEAEITRTSGRLAFEEIGLSSRSAIDGITSTVKPVAAVRRRMPVKMRRPRPDYEETEARTTESSDKSPRTPLPPVPFPTLSPWIDGYGK